MRVPVGNEMVEVTGKELTLYVFCGNFDPVYNEEETELTVIKMAAPNEEYAWTRLKSLIGFARAKHFHIEDMYKYD